MANGLRLPSRLSVSATSFVSSCGEESVDGVKTEDCFRFQERLQPLEDGTNSKTIEYFNFVYEIMSLHNHPLFSEKRAACGLRAFAPIDRNTAENWPIAT